MSLTLEQVTQLVNIYAARKKIQTAIIKDPAGLKPTRAVDIELKNNEISNLKSQKASGKISRSKYVSDIKKIENDLHALLDESRKNEEENRTLWEEKEKKIRDAIVRLNNAETAILHTADLTDIDKDAKGEI